MISKPEAARLRGLISRQRNMQKQTARIQTTENRTYYTNEAEKAHTALLAYIREITEKGNDHATVQKRT